jgi:hypothetical protein
MSASPWRRGVDVGGVGDGGVFDVGLEVVEGGAAPLLFAELDGDVGLAVHADEVGDGGGDDGGFEAVRVADGPRGHEAAVRVAVDAEAVFVDVAEAEDAVDGGHLVFVVFAAPVLEDAGDEVAAVGG